LNKSMTTTYIAHYGIKGQRWGVRRYQNEDGSLTNEGLLRYGSVENFEKSRERNRKKALGVGIGIGATALVVGGAILYRKNKKMRNELITYKLSEAKRLENLAKGREILKAKRIKAAADAAAGNVVPKVIKIAAGSNVKISSVTKNNVEVTKEILNVISGTVKVAVKGGGV